MWFPIELPAVKFNGRLVAIIAAMVAIVVFLIAWQLWKPKPAPPEVYKPATTQKDGSVILEKKPDAAAKPRHVIPKGATVERVASVTVQPSAVYAPMNTAKQPARTTFVRLAALSPFGRYTAVTQPDVKSPCPPVTVDLTLIHDPDNTRRVIASSPDGAVVGGVDIPVEAAVMLPAPKLWAVGAVVNPFKNTFGAFLDRDLGPFRLGTQINQRDEGRFIPQFWLKGGLRF